MKTSRIGLAWGVACLLSLSCAGSSGPGDLGKARPDLSNDGGVNPDLASTACVMGAPMTELDLFNQCTTAEVVTRDSRVPPVLWDGKSPLPPAP